MKKYIHWASRRSIIVMRIMRKTWSMFKCYNIILWSISMSISTSLPVDFFLLYRVCPLPEKSKAKEGTSARCGSSPPAHGNRVGRCDPTNGTTVVFTFSFTRTYRRDATTTDAFPTLRNRKCATMLCKRTRPEYHHQTHTDTLNA